MTDKKAFNGSATTSFYKTKSPSGKEVIFTITDLVQGKGKLKDPDGDGKSSFKPKKYKAHTMSEMVNKPEFGKTKKSIKKISYRSRPEEELIISEDLPSISQVDDSYTENGGRYGFIMPGDTYPVSSGLPAEINEQVPPNMFKPKSSIDEADDFNENLESLLVELKAGADEADDVVCSNFAGFLITKCAQANKISYESLFIEYIYKIYMSDMVNSSAKIEKLSIDFSELTRKYFDSGLPIERSKEMAYKEVVARSGLLKEAQVVLTDPKNVAEQISKIILIMVSKFSMESRTKARANIRNRISNLNVSDMAAKKTPAGAAIGTSIALVKNILNGKDGYFIKAVLEELKKHI